MVSSPFDRTWERTVVAGAVLTAVGSLPTWVTVTVDESLLEAGASAFESTARGGITGDGLLTFLLAALAVGLLWRAFYLDAPDSSWKRGVLVALFGALSLLTVGVTYQDMQTFAGEIESLNEVGAIPAGSEALTIHYSIAIWLVLAGGVLITIGGLLGVVDGIDRRDRTGPDQYLESP